MGNVRVIEIKENIFAKNELIADATRAELKKNGTFFLNVMSSPGSGKTTLLTAVINALKDRCKIAEMDVDIESSFDSQKVADATGVKSVQIHNGGLCHIDADMTARAIEELKADMSEDSSDSSARNNKFGFESLDILILENIGNLVCPAEFDTGAHKNMMILSVPEGDDKPLKYPLMFSVSDVVIISKTDTADFFDFDFDRAEKNIRNLNPAVTIIPCSAKTGEGISDVCDWIENQRKNLNQ